MQLADVDNNSNMAQRVDYVLVYEHPDFNKDASTDTKTKMENLRRRFLVGLRKESLDVEEERVGKYMFVKITCTSERLYTEAELMRIELPLTGLILRNPEKKCSMIEKRMKRIFSARINESNVQVTAPFQKRCLDIFTGNQPNRAPIFWSALRSILVYNIITQIDIGRKGEEDVGTPKRQGIAYLRMVGAFNDGFVVHDPSSLEPVSMRAAKRGSSATATLPEDTTIPGQDLRRQLQRLWGNGICRRQPIHLIRDYFGEKIAFYFAWVSTFISSLWIPAFLGTVVFIFGVIKRYTDTDRQQTGFLRYVDIIKNSSDNALTPCFAAIICLWGTILMEVWKRRQISLAHQWHVEEFDMVEPDRPQFHGTHSRTDMLTGERRRYYPFIRRLFKYFSSASVLLFMVLLVFISVTSVILYRVFMTASFCERGDGICVLFHGTMVATFLNTVSIMILGRIYEHIAVKLTDWENHRTTSEYTDALIIKLYAFQFANTYTSLFYTAFFRRDFNGIGIFGLGSRYTDNCGDAEHSNCMSMLSFQLLALMILKPFPKFCKDVLFPLMRRCFRSCRINEINDAQTDGGVSKQHYLLRERFKQSAEDFRLGEFTEKMIQYGYLMMFAASFPLAPLLALLFNVIDLRIDAKRLLWWTKRPTPYRDNDIGIWFHIINFINVCAVISNGFLIAFNSEVGRDQPLEIKFAIIIGFEHFVFFMKFALSLIIPDTPTWVKNSQRKERFLISYLMSRWASGQDPESGAMPPPEATSEVDLAEPIHLSQSLDFRRDESERQEVAQSRWSYG